MIGLVAAPIGFAAAGLLILLITQITAIWGLRPDLSGLVFVVPAATIMAALWLFDSRQKQGMQLHRYKAMMNSRQARGQGSAERMIGVMLVNGQIPDKPAFIAHTPLAVVGVVKQDEQVGVDAIDDTPVIAKGSRRKRRTKRDWSTI